MFYKIFRKLAFTMSPELMHNLTIKGLRASYRRGTSYIPWRKTADKPVELMGLTFRNAVGLAAGMDKDAAAIDAFGAMGFGFVEVGTVTPRPQPGNPKPRLFRIPEHQAIINRMGFNNHGVDHLIENVMRCRFDGVLGINIGKNFDTPIEEAASDYLHCMEAVYNIADYIAVNISSPNTTNLRSLQEGDALSDLLFKLKQVQGLLNRENGKYTPLVLKVAPDLDPAQVDAIARLLKEHQFDGLIATNTTISREGVEDHPKHTEAGGLSGTPVRAKSTAIIKSFREKLGPDFPIIGVGGIMSLADAKEKLDAGADLLQIYSGLIYKGPGLVRRIVKGL